MSKIKLPAILLNNDFYSKPRNKKWIKEHGFEAIAILHVVWIAISQEKDCKLKIEETEFLDYPAFFNFEKITTVLNSAIEVGLLEKDENSYFNSQITDKFNKFKKKREIYQQNADRRWQKDDAKQNAIAYPIAQKNDSDLQCKSTLPLSLTLPLDINKNSAPEYVPHTQPKDEIPEDADEALKAAYAELEAPTNQSWTLTNAYMLSGRRPLKKYPEVFLTPIELSDIFKNLNEKVPKNQWKPIFQRVQARVKKQCHDQHRKPDQVYPYDWLMSFEVTKQLEQVIQTKRLESIEARR